MEQQTTYRLPLAIRVLLLIEILLLTIIGVVYLWALPTWPEFQFQYKQLWYVWVGTGLLSLLFLAAIVRRNRALSTFATPRQIPRMVPQLSTTAQVTKYVLWRLGIAFVALALLNPRFGQKLTEVKKQGIDLMICLDVSNSMLATDLTPNRLLTAKRAITKLMGELSGDRVGLIVFAGDAYVQLPITTDYNAAQMFMRTVDNTMVPTQGTNIGAAIDLAVESFSTNADGSRAIIVITDGENHEADAIEAAKRAQGAGCTVHTIGMGSEAGAPIPQLVNGRVNGYKKDKQGSTVISKIDEQMLSQVAAAGEGVYIRATNGDVGLDLLLEEIESMEKSEFGTEEYADYEDRYQWALLPGVLLLLIEFILSGHARRKEKQQWIS